MIHDMDNILGDQSRLCKDKVLYPDLVKVLQQLGIQQHQLARHACLWTCMNRAKGLYLDLVEVLQQLGGLLVLSTHLHHLHARL